MKNLIFILIVITIAGCSTDPEAELAPQGGYISFEVPSNFPAPAYDFSTNPITQEGFELGRRLFYDPFLSRDGSISCESCHQQFVAFAHEDHALSHGIDNRFGDRNAPGLFNLAWHSNMMWDGGVESIEVQPIAPIENHVEMDEDILNVIDKLQNHPTYPSLFKKAFGSETITLPHFLKAITQFQGAIVSANSKYDRVVRGEGAVFTAEEEAGRLIFNDKCGSCHSTDLFTDLSFRNNGLDATVVDSGRAKDHRRSQMI